MADLETTYLGHRLRSPIVASAGPLTGDGDTAAEIADAGAGALVLPSLFEEEVVREELTLAAALEAGVGQYAEASDYFPSVGDFPSATDRYLAHLDAVRSRVEVPAIASLNARTPGRWGKYAGMLADAGASAIELNLYHVAADPHRRAQDVETDDLALIATVSDAVEVPIAVKLSPYYSALANFAARAVDAGAEGLVLFNRFYQPDIELDTLEITPHIELSSRWELRLPLRWIAILRPLVGSRAALAATSGIESGTDVAKSLLVGADVAMMTSALLRHGPEHVRAVETELLAWLTEHEYQSVDELRGSLSYSNADDPSSFERAHYVRVLHSWTRS